MSLKELAKEYYSSARLIKQRIKQLDSEKLALQLQIHDLDSHILRLTIYHNQLIRIYNHLKQYHLN